MKLTSGSQSSKKCLVNKADGEKDRKRERKREGELVKIHNEDESSFSKPTKQLNINALKNPIFQKPHRATVYS